MLKINGVENLSVVDYEGYLSMTFFTSNCNMRCPFCHNSELVLNKVPTSYSKADIESLLKKREGMIDAIVISGGEPTLDEDGLVELINLIRKYSYKIKLDTNGTNPEILRYLIENQLIDYVAMDIKNTFDKYPLTIDIINPPYLDKIKESISYLIKQQHIEYEFRTTLIDEFHSYGDIKYITSIMLKGAKKYRLQKFVDNENCFYCGLHPVPLEIAQEMKKIAAQAILDSELRSY